MGRIDNDGKAAFELTYRTFPLEYKVQETGSCQNLVVNDVDKKGNNIDNQGTTQG